MLPFSDYQVSPLKTTDWPGFLLLNFQLNVIPLVLVLPIVIVRIPLDPFHFIFQLVLADPYEKILLLKLFIFILRLLVTYFFIFEFMRFVSLLTLFSLSFAFTIMNCMQNCIIKPKSLDRITLHNFIHLRVIFKLGDYFIRHIVSLIIIITQVTFIIAGWVVIRGWHKLPVYIILEAFMGMLIALISMIVFLKVSNKIGETSKTYLKDKCSANHTFAKFHKNRYYYLKWYAQKSLRIRFCSQFVLEKDTIIQYFSKLVTNLTDAILLINPL